MLFRSNDIQGVSITGNGVALVDTIEKATNGTNTNASHAGGNAGYTATNIRTATSFEGEDGVSAK